MSPQLTATLLCGVLMAWGSAGAVASEATMSRLTGHFAYVSGSEPDDIAIYITIRSEADGKFSLGLMAAQPDAHGAAPDGGGDGRIERDGIFRFYTPSDARSRPPWLILFSVDVATRLLKRTKPCASQI
jgi:hypothetical protein